jgi:hypothetical protein
MGLHEYIYVNEYLREIRLLYVVRLLTKREQAKLLKNKKRLQRLGNGSIS